MAETIHVRGEGGAIFAMDLPLPEPIAERLAKGQLKRVNPDGTPYTGGGGVPAPAAEQGSALTDGRVPRPGARASKDDWVLWAMAVHSLAEADAEAMTKTQLQELPEQPGPPTAADGRPAEDAPKSDWIAHIVRKGLLSREDAEAYTKDDLIAMVS